MNNETTPTDQNPPTSNIVELSYIPYLTTTLMSHGYDPIQYQVTDEIRSIIDQHIGVIIQNQLQPIMKGNWLKQPATDQPLPVFLLPTANELIQDMMIWSETKPDIYFNHGFARIKDQFGDHYCIIITPSYKSHQRFLYRTFNRPTLDTQCNRFFMPITLTSTTNNPEGIDLYQQHVNQNTEIRIGLSNRACKPNTTTPDYSNIHFFKFKSTPESHDLAHKQLQQYIKTRYVNQVTQNLFDALGLNKHR